jgi:Zn-dependent M28 family amino/carboxypeptidase
MVPCRVLNDGDREGRRSTLHVVDDWLERRLRSFGYPVERDLVKVQAFMPDPSVPHGFRKPLPHEPWYDAFNLIARKVGTTEPDRAIVLVAHKDSQSWLHRAPGAYDNAVGVAALLEIARILENIDLAITVLWLFCNEEHWPWTSVEAARRLAASDLTLEAVLNVDGIGGKSPEAAKAGLHTAVTRFVTPEGKRLAELLASLNQSHDMGLQHTVYEAAAPNDDDGSFINAGIRPAVMVTGSIPFADPNYHTVLDRPEHVDVRNVAKSTCLVLATVLELAG